MDKAICDLCESNHEWTGTPAKCTSIEGTKHATCLTANKAASATNCLTCDPLLFREIKKTAETDAAGECKCKVGYRPDADATKTTCVACGTGAATCDKDKALTCVDALTKVVVGTVCVSKENPAAADIPEGFSYNSVSKAFEACSAKC